MAHIRKGKQALKSRQAAADERAVARSKRSNDEQLKLIEARPGFSKRERIRLGFAFTLARSYMAKHVPWLHDESK